MCEHRHVSISVRRPYQCCRSHRADPKEPLTHPSCILYAASITDTPGQKKVGRKIGSLKILGSQALDLWIGIFFIPSVPCRVTLAVKETGIIRIKSRRERSKWDSVFSVWKFYMDFAQFSKVQGLISVYVRQMMYSEKRAEGVSECFLLLSPQHPRLPREVCLMYS